MDFDITDIAPEHKSGGAAFERRAGVLERKFIHAPVLGHRARH